MAAEWQALIGADTAIVTLPCASGLRGVLSDPALVQAQVEYEAYFQERDAGLVERLPKLEDPSVCHEEDLFHRGELLRDEAYVDWRTPHKLLDPLLLTVPSGQLTPALLIAYRDRDRDGYRLNQKAGLARLVYPAFRSAARFWYRADRWAGDLEGFVEHAGVGCMVYAARGDSPPSTTRAKAARVEPTLLHMNERARRILGGPGRDSAGLQAGARTLARRVLATSPVLSEPSMVLHGVQMTTFRAGLDGGCAAVAAQVGGASPSTLEPSAPGNPAAFALVTVEDLRQVPLDLGAVERGAGLTPRQAQVAVLTARGLSHKEVARELGIRPNTARRHREAVLRRLGIHSWREIRGRLDALVDRGGDRP